MIVDYQSRELYTLKALSTNKCLQSIDELFLYLRSIYLTKHSHNLILILEDDNLYDRRVALIAFVQLLTQNKWRYR